jgi:hypothetical protein
MAKENMYQDVKGNIFKIVKNFLQEFLDLAPIIILIILLFNLKVFLLCEEFPQNISL